MKSIIKYELIGNQAEIVNSTNKSNIGIKGKITDETKYTIIINKKRLFKKNITLIIKMKDKKYKIKGELLTKRPKDRIK